MSNDIHGVLHTMPKLELHLHLEGAVRYNTASELYSKSARGKDFDISSIRSTDRYDNLRHFVSTMKYIGDACLKSHNDYERIAYELFCDLDDSNTIYAEVSYDPTRAFKIGIAPESIMEAVAEAKLRVEAERSIRIGLIMGLDHETAVETAIDLINKAATQRKNYAISGIDLHGNEAAAAPSKFAHAYRLAREAGLGLRAHAGESCEAKNIWESIEYLKVDRIGHGIGAITDKTLMDYLAAHKDITLDICPTSNYRLGLVKSYEEHPVRTFLEKGIQFSISTDDPLYFNTTLENEYYLLYKHCGFSIQDIQKVNQYAIQGSFADADLKSKLAGVIENADSYSKKF